MMGACFASFIPTSDASMSYWKVFDIKMRLLGLIDEELAEVWESMSMISTFKMEETNMKIDHVEMRLNELEKSIGKLDTDEAKLVRGVKTFVLHSDCDGRFWTDECGDVAFALRKLNEQEGEEGGVIESLITVFDDAYNGDGEVCIY